MNRNRRQISIDSTIFPFAVFVVSYIVAMNFVDRAISDSTQTSLLAPVVGVLLALAIALWWRHGPQRNRSR